MIVNVSPEIEKRLQQIAVVRGQSVPDVASSLLEEKLFQESEAPIFLTDHDRDLFLQALDADEMPHPKLVKAAQRFRETLGTESAIKP